MTSIFEKAGRKVRIFLEMIKFEHSIFALPFAYLGLILGERGLPGGFLLFWITVAMVSFRSMAMGANRLIDHEIDSRNPRTENRALPARQISVSVVWILTLLFMGVFLAAAAVLGPLCLKLAVFPLVLAWIYPFLKRFTWLCHFVLGIILGIAPYGAWIASRGSFSWTPGFLMAGITCWVAGFDIIYALQDFEFDKKHGLHSFPAKFGKRASLWTTRVLHLLTLAAWLMAGRHEQLGLVYWIGMVFVAGFLIREHWLVARHDLARIQEAFFTMNAIVSVAIFLAVLTDILI